MRLFLFSLFASHITSVAPMVIGKGNIEKNEESPFLEMNKTVANSSTKKPNLSLYRIMITKENYSQEETIPPQSLREELFPHATIKFPIKESTDKTRHATLSKNEDRDFDGCRKEDMIVHTAELGLPTKYIQPEKFNAYQCKGKCSLKQWRKYIIHSLLKAYLEDKKGIKVDNNACCVPTKLRPMSLFYYNETLGFVRHILTNAIVEECGCY
ncbi:nodal homolog [Stylophora pistillata]|uniref:Nodal-like n=1 Tax=Stylophora pistillata TaxID=50429 RepID=A0A2B4S7L7_STYPI|nr:nodal homolog [Stylophora pistillata]PFX24597.1 Nodal-like [Stylophora pistillata]